MDVKRDFWSLGPLNSPDLIFIIKNQNSIEEN
jgi:hypothetical protein